jgi:hypothetical protein
MKGLQWTKVAYGKIKGTVWEKLPESASYLNVSSDYFEGFKGELDYDQLEGLFAAKVIEKKAKGFSVCL